MATHPHSAGNKAGSIGDKVERPDGQVAATAAMIPMVASAPIHGYAVPGWSCPDCSGHGVGADHLCAERAARLERIHGRPITAEEHASWQQQA